MGWLLALATTLALAAMGFAGVTTYVVMSDRRRRHAAHQRLLAQQRAQHTARPTAVPAELNQVAERAQRWLDALWEQKFGRGLQGSSDTVDG